MTTYRIQAYTRGVSVPSQGAALAVTRGPNQGSVYRLGRDPVTIGRRPSSFIVLDDISVSRDHAEIRSWDDIHAVIDSGSLNGTYVNGQQVEEARLRHGDQLQVGVFKLVYLTQGTS